MKQILSFLFFLPLITMLYAQDSDGRGWLIGGSFQSLSDYRNAESANSKSNSWNVEIAPQLTWQWNENHQIGGGFNLNYSAGKTTFRANEIRSFGRNFSLNAEYAYLHWLKPNLALRGSVRPQFAANRNYQYFNITLNGGLVYRPNARIDLVLHGVGLDIISWHKDDQTIISSGNDGNTRVSSGSFNASLPGQIYSGIGMLYRLNAWDTGMEKPHQDKIHEQQEKNLLIANFSVIKSNSTYISAGSNTPLEQHSMIIPVNISWLRHLDEKNQSLGVRLGVMPSWIRSNYNNGSRNQESYRLRNWVVAVGPSYRIWQALGNGRWSLFGDIWAYGRIESFSNTGIDARGFGAQARPGIFLQLGKRWGLEGTFGVVDINYSTQGRNNNFKGFSSEIKLNPYNLQLGLARRF